MSFAAGYRLLHQQTWFRDFQVQFYASPLQIIPDGLPEVMLTPLSCKPSHGSTITSDDGDDVPARLALFVYRHLLEVKSSVLLCHIQQSLYPFADFAVHGVSSCPVCSDSSRLDF